MKIPSAGRFIVLGDPTARQVEAYEPQRSILFPVDMDVPHGSVRAGLELSFSNRKEAVDWAAKLMEACLSFPPTKLGRKPEHE